MNPNSKHSKLQHRQEQETEQQTQHSQHSRQEQAGQKFETVEELLRHDAQQVAVPPTLTKRLQESIAKEPNHRSWWQRLFGPRN
jgi:hypothetical protein